MASGLLIFLILLNVYILLIYLAARSGLLARLNMSLFGPLLMVRTQRGKDLIEWMSGAKRLWTWVSTAGVWVTLAFMFLFTGYLVWQVPQLFRIPVEFAPKASEILVIPGLNPFVPLGYGLVSLITAVVIHEFSHGVAARIGGMRVKSLGALFFIVPVGAFVEPDEDDVKASPRMARMRVFAAGPTSNFVTAILFGLLFSSVMVAAVQPVTDGVPVIRAVEHSPAEAALIDGGWVITSVNGTATPTYDAFAAAVVETRPGQRVEIAGTDDGAPSSVSLCLASRDQFANGSSPGPNFDFCSLDGAGDAFLGIERLPLSPAGFKDLLQHPLRSPIQFATFLALPILRLSPIEGATQDLYTTPWADTFVGDDGYWIVANTVYWIFWISLLLGLFNALPAVPLDGGHLFRDFAGGLIKRLAPKTTEHGRDKTVKGLSIAFTSLIATLILLHIFAPRIGALF